MLENWKSTIGGRVRLSLRDNRSKVVFGNSQFTIDTEDRLLHQSQAARRHDPFLNGKFVRVTEAAAKPEPKPESAPSGPPVTGAGPEPPATGNDVTDQGAGVSPEPDEMAAAVVDENTNLADDDGTISEARMIELIDGNAGTLKKALKGVKAPAALRHMLNLAKGRDASEAKQNAISARLEAALESQKVGRDLPSDVSPPMGPNGPLERVSK